mgnify:FL=1
MNNNIMKKFCKELRLNACLNSIEECCNATYGYITGEYKVNDLNELEDALLCIPDYIKEIKEIIEEIIDIYEQEGLNNE